MRMFRSLVLIACLVLAVGCNESGDVIVSETIVDAVVITVDDSQRYQEMDGFGASMTDSSAWLFANSMNDKQRRAALVELFDADEGIGLTYLRQPMGTSDFRVSSEMGGFDEYTYDDMPAGETDYITVCDSVISVPVWQLVSKLIVRSNAIIRKSFVFKDPYPQTQLKTFLCKQFAANVLAVHVRNAMRDDYS